MIMGSYFRSRQEDAMQLQLSLALAHAHQQDLARDAAEYRRRSPRRELPADRPAPLSWAALTVRLATGADRPALARLADLEEARRPADPVLLAVVGGRPLAALSLEDGGVIADPFVRTTELVELLRVRARQLRAR
jgi:hypothetical protein